MGDWLDTTIGDQVLLQRGIDITKAQQRPGSVPVVSSGGISSYHDTAYSDGPGVVLGRKGVVGSVWFVEGEYWPHDTTLWVRDFKGNEPRFVYYFFLNHASRLAGLDVGSANPTLNRNHVHPTPARWPPPDEQRAIASILGSLDDKIELNRRMNRTLEQMAAAIFKAWFVDFEPVRAKASGAASFPGMPQAVFDALPAAFVDSELGPIPEGWEVTTIENLCSSISSGGTPARRNRAYWDNGTIPWFKTGELLDGPLLDSAEKITPVALEESSCKLWRENTVLFALYASPTVGRLGILTANGTSNQAAAGLVAKAECGTQFLVHTLLQARGRLQQIAVGAAQQNINQGVLKRHRVPNPPSSVAARFSDAASLLYNLRVSLARESRTLTKTRDTLLPKLLSGEVRIHNTTLAVQEVV